MKRFLFLLFAGIVSVVTSGMGVARTFSGVGVDELPSSARSFMKRHFSTLTIHSVDVRNGMPENEFQVKLAGGCEVLFDGRGEWMRIDCNRTTVPASAVPERIGRYMAGNHAERIIVAIEREENGNYKIKLDTGEELPFTSKGESLE